jgi:integrase
MAALRGRDGVAAQALQFLILTSARTSEVLGARWSEIGLDNAVWTVPPERMKMHRAHRVPLSKPAVELLRSLYREHGNDSVFIGAHNGGSTLSSTAMVALLRRMGRDDITGHGFRSSFRTWAAEQTNFPREVAEAALAHAIPDKVEAAYRRTAFFDKRRQLMAQWAKYCLGLPRQKVVAGDNVVTIGAR